LTYQKYHREGSRVTSLHDTGARKDRDSKISSKQANQKDVKVPNHPWFFIKNAKSFLLLETHLEKILPKSSIKLQATFLTTVPWQKSAHHRDPGWQGARPKPP